MFTKENYKSMDKTLSLTLSINDVNIIVKSITQRLTPWAENRSKKYDDRLTYIQAYFRFIDEFKDEFNTLKLFYNSETAKEIENFNESCLNVFIKNRKNI